MTHVQYGCGHSAPDGWLNYDASFTLRVERFPLGGRFVRKNAQRFPANVSFGDIVKGLPVSDASVDGVYASHVLEHLSRTSDIDGMQADANDRLLRSTYLGVEADPRGLLGLASEMLGRNKHLWMWDYPAMEAALKAVGFSSIRRCEMGDSGDPAFAAVEQHDRFYDEPSGIRELAVHCHRPND